MPRIRYLEILSANALLKVLSDRIVPQTDQRVLQFLADKGAVSVLLNTYEQDQSLEKLCVGYWDSKLEPDLPRYEDLVSTILIAFATSFAATVLVESGKAVLPKIYQKFFNSPSIQQSVKQLSQLEKQRRGHADT